MIATKVTLDCGKISDWQSFHQEFAHAFGFPDFYGKNMNAWIDCLTYIDDPEARMTTIHCNPGSVMVIELLNVKPFKQRCPDQYDAIIEDAAFVNRRRLKVEHPAVLAISFWN